MSDLTKSADENSNERNRVLEKLPIRIWRFRRVTNLGRGRSAIGNNGNFSAVKLFWPFPSKISLLSMKALFLTRRKDVSPEKASLNHTPQETANDYK